MQQVQTMISGGLLKVFIGMLVFAVLQLLATLLMAKGKSAEPLTRAETLEALAA